MNPNARYSRYVSRVCEFCHTCKLAILRAFALDSLDAFHCASRITSMERDTKKSLVVYPHTSVTVIPADWLFKSIICSKGSGKWNCISRKQMFYLRSRQDVCAGSISSPAPCCFAWGNPDESFINHLEWLLSQHPSMYPCASCESAYTRASIVMYDTVILHASAIRRGLLSIARRYLFLAPSLYSLVQSSRSFWVDRERSRRDFATVLMTAEWRRWWILIKRSLPSP